MNIVLWIVQALLASTFLMTGSIKFTKSSEFLHQKLPAVGHLTINTIRFIGLAEILASLGLILPEITGIAVRLTPLAAIGLSAIMVPATLVHIRRNEPKEVTVNLVLLTMTVFVAWGSFAS